MHGYFLLLLQKAKELGIHRTVHAGENGPAADVEEVCIGTILVQHKNCVQKVTRKQQQ